MAKSSIVSNKAKQMSKGVKASTPGAKKRIDISKAHLDMPFPNLVEAQLRSYDEFLRSTLIEVFQEISPVEDNTGKLWTLEFLSSRLGDTNRSPVEAMSKGLSYDAPLFFTSRLINKHTGEVKEQELFICDLPLMTDRGTFIVNGNERAVVHQIIRSEGVLFIESGDKAESGPLYLAKLIPERGAWFNFEVNKHDVISIKLAPKRPKIPITELLRVLGYSTNQEILSLFSDVDTNPDRKFIESTLLKDTTSSREEAVLDIYKKLRPDVATTYDNAKAFIDNIFFNSRRVYLGKTGRYQLNRKLGIDTTITPENFVLYPSDVVAVIKRLVQVNNGAVLPDDMDSMENRRVKSVGELVADFIRVGVRRVEKNIKDRMSIHAADELLVPATLVSTRPIAAALNEFFGSSEVSRYMDQENILSELGNKRRLTSGGPGGLTKERATFSVRDTHYSQYGRLCPIETPEGANIGIVNHLAVYARINEYGFLETPYRRVFTELDFAKLKETMKEDDLINLMINRMSRVDVEKNGKVIIAAGEYIKTKTQAQEIMKAVPVLQIKPYVTDTIDYLSAGEEFEHVMTSASVDRDEFNNIVPDLAPIRLKGNFSISSTDNISYIDAGSIQIAGTGFALVPFAASDESQRTLMAANMQRQAIPLLKPESPIVGTGFEGVVARNSGRAVYAPCNGVIEYADAQRIVVKADNATGKSAKHEYRLEKFIGTNQSTSFSQQVVVKTGDIVTEGQLIADGPCMQLGELALGKNITVAYMLYEGFNYEDGIVLSERLVKDDVLTSVHITEYSQEIRETRLGDEQLTADLPGVAEYSLRNLDPNGIVRIGAEVKAGDVLAGIIAPKGETELTAEERLLRAIFGEYARDVRDNSLKMPNGEEGIITDVQVLSKDAGDKLSPGVLKVVKIWVAKTRKITIGDKLAGRHGDKGVISKILPIEDMPYVADGTPIDIILSPLGLTKRMNMGQLLETHLGLRAQKLGEKFAVPIFSKVDTARLDKMLKDEGIEVENKVVLYDGRTGKPFAEKITVGPRYILKLNHLADEKIHARATGSYTMVTQQPLGGKAQFGGQRFGEMEVWALEAYGAGAILQEMLTIKSDDVIGRAEAYKAIIHGKAIGVPGIPEGFKVLMSELRALGLNLETIEAEDKPETNMAIETTVEDVVDEPGVIMNLEPVNDVAVDAATGSVEELERLA